MFAVDVMVDQKPTLDDVTVGSLVSGELTHNPGVGGLGFVYVEWGNGDGQGTPIQDLPAFIALMFSLVHPYFFPKSRQTPFGSCPLRVLLVR